MYRTESLLLFFLLIITACAVHPENKNQSPKKSSEIKIDTIQHPDGSFRVTRSNGVYSSSTSYTKFGILSYRCRSISSGYYSDTIKINEFNQLICDLFVEETGLAYYSGECDAFYPNGLPKVISIPLENTTDQIKTIRYDSLGNIQSTEYFKFDEKNFCWIPL
jgi:hypothetical protein